MSNMTKTLLKLITGVVAIYLIIAAVPVGVQTYHNLRGEDLKITLPSFSWVGDTLAKVGTTIKDIIPSSTNDTDQAEPEGSAVSPSVTPEEGGEVIEVAPSLTATDVGPTPTTDAQQGLNVEGNGGPVVISLPIVSNGISFAFGAQDGTPVYMQNFAHTDAGCNWFAVAGQALDASGNPAVGLVVNIKGTLDGNPIDLMGMTGSADAYGPGGFEIMLGTTPVASTGTLTIQLFDLKGMALSDKIPFDTSADCSQNVVLINFN